MTHEPRFRKQLTAAAAAAALLLSCPGLPAYQAFAAVSLRSGAEMQPPALGSSAVPASPTLAAPSFNPTASPEAGIPLAQAGLEAAVAEIESAAPRSAPVAQTAAASLAGLSLPAARPEASFSAAFDGARPETAERVAVPETPAQPGRLSGLGRAVARGAAALTGVLALAGCEEIPASPPPDSSPSTIAFHAAALLGLGLMAVLGWRALSRLPAKTPDQPADDPEALPRVASSRLAALPPYIFVRMDQLKHEAVDAGQDVIDLGKGSPDLAAPEAAVSALIKAVADPKNHTYPRADGTPEFRKAIADWYQERFGVTLDPETQILPLIGSKEGIAHTLLAMIDPGDSVLVPSPGYPAYANQVIAAGGRVLTMPLTEKNAFLPDFKELEGRVAAANRRSRVRAMILNYPSNPTGAVAPDMDFLKRALAFARKHRLLVFYDNAYSEIGFDGYQAPTMLQVPGAVSHTIEYHTFSKSFSMAGFRVGYAVGNPEAIAALAKLKGFFDYGIAGFNQAAATAVLAQDDSYLKRTRATYEARRDALVAELRKIGWEVAPPRGAMYLWAKLPKAAGSMTSLEFAERLIREQGVVLSPGSAFGPEGEGYVRISLIQPVERLREAVGRIGVFLASLPGKP